MTDRTPSDASAADALTRLADEILPALIARLDVSELGELEVRHAGWRVRLRRGATGQVSSSAAPVTGAPGAPSGPSAETARRGAGSPAVGYFVPNERTAVGRTIASGDVLGWVDVLGVRQEVVAPRDGIVGRFLAEAGQAVEYGQELVIIDTHRRAAEASATDAGTAPAGPTTAVDA